MENPKPAAIDLKSIQDLLKESFLVPQYQRGYRWTVTQVQELLDDLDQFQRNSVVPTDFYCLQPLVVKGIGERRWELVDGQQRLTTIYILLQHLRESLLRGASVSFGLEYATRPQSQQFLQKINKGQRGDNVDFYHIVGALEAVEAWFTARGKGGEDVGRLAMKLYDTLLDRTKVIWYVLGPEENGHAVFARINSGKIPLTNAELVKAVFLKQSKAGLEEPQFLQRQVEIAKEWDGMEAQLQQQDFWYFLNEGTSEPATRIDVLFTLLVVIDQPKDQYDTFRHYQQLLNQATGERVLKEWQKVRELFLLLQDWFRTREWYHRIGYLVSVGEPLRQLVTDSRSMSKSAFRRHLQTRIKHWVAGDWDELVYGKENNDALLKRILLLFNVETIQASESDDARFPFYQFKGKGQARGGWSLEHIHAQNSRNLNGSDHYRNWLKDVRPDLEEPVVAVREGDEERGRGQVREPLLVDLTVAVDHLIGKAEISKIEFQDVQERIVARFGEPELHTLENLALLARDDNSALGNGTFPQKRRCIVELEKAGAFIPVATRNVFLKYYTKGDSHLSYWTAQDREDYRQSIQNTLSAYRTNKS